MPVIYFLLVLKSTDTNAYYTHRSRLKMSDGEWFAKFEGTGGEFIPFEEFIDVLLDSDDVNLKVGLPIGEINENGSIEPLPGCPSV